MAPMGSVIRTTYLTSRSYLDAHALEHEEGRFRASRGGPRGLAGPRLRLAATPIKRQPLVGRPGCDGVLSFFVTGRTRSPL